MVWIPHILAAFSGVAVVYATSSGSSDASTISQGYSSLTATSSEPTYTGTDKPPASKDDKSPANKDDKPPASKDGKPPASKDDKPPASKDGKSPGEEKKPPNDKDAKKKLDDAKKKKQSKDSGYNSGNQKYNDCIQQCQAKNQLSSSSQISSTSETSSTSTSDSSSASQPSSTSDSSSVASNLSSASQPSSTSDSSSVASNLSSASQPSSTSDSSSVSSNLSSASQPSSTSDSSSVASNSSSAYEPSVTQYEPPAAAAYDISAAYGAPSTSDSSSGSEPSSTYQESPSNTNSPPSSGSSNGGKTHTVIVAPTQGVLRYVPFALQADIGDTVQFKWGANNHTVTKSSALFPCNQTLDASFTSPIQQKDSSFEFVVNNTDAVYFHCTVATHCQKGMFAMINPLTNQNGSTSFDNIWPSIKSNSSSAASYSDSMTSSINSSSPGAQWGGNIDFAQLPNWAYEEASKNIFYTRTFLASNPETLQDNGFIDLNSGTPLVVPKEASVSADNSVPPSSTTTDVAATGGSYLSSGGEINVVSKAIILGQLALVISYTLI